MIGNKVSAGIALGGYMIDEESDLSGASSPDPEARVSAVLSRQLWDKAVLAFHLGDEVNLMTGVLLADLAMETALRAALPEHGKDKVVPALIGLAAQKFPALTPVLCQKAKRLHELRNMVQHAAQAPTRPSVTRTLQGAVPFLKQLFLAGMGLLFDDLSVVDLCSDSLLKGALKAATRSLKEGSHQRATLLVAFCYEQMRLRVSDVLVYLHGVDEALRGYLPEKFCGLALAVLKGGHDFDTAGLVGTETQLADKANEIGSLGRLGFTLVDEVRLQRFYKMARKAVGPLGDEWDEAAFNDMAPKDVEYAIDQVARQVWRLEQLEPELFGALAHVYRARDPAADEAQEAGG